MRGLRWGNPTSTKEPTPYEKRYHEARINHFRATAAEPGFQLVPETANA